MATRLPPLNALVVFEAAARHLSFTRAADSLHVTQAAVSHQIKALEEWLGVTLFHRVGRGKGLALTEAGRNYLPRVNGALEAIRGATNAVMDKRRQRVLNVATLDSFGLLWLVPRLRRFLARNAGVHVRVIAADLDDDALAMGEVDIDLRYGEGDWPGLEVVRFMTETIFPVCSPDIVTAKKPLCTPEDLQHHALLHDELMVDWRAWVEAAGYPSVDVDRGPGFNHSHFVVAAAVQGDGVALGRSALVTDAIEKGQLVKPFEFVLPCRFAYYAVCSHGSAEDPVVVAFRNWLLEEGAASQAAQDAVARAPAEP
jgi:LysR family glycine cleavage system transcriptional activator